MQCIAPETEQSLSKLWIHDAWILKTFTRAHSYGLFNHRHIAISSHQIEILSMRLRKCRWKWTWQNFIGAKTFECHNHYYYYSYYFWPRFFNLLSTRVSLSLFLSLCAVSLQINLSMQNVCSMFLVWYGIWHESLDTWHIFVYIVTQLRASEWCWVSEQKD